MTKQDQTSGDNSTNIQAGGDVTVHQGVTYADARQIAQDLFNANFLQLAGVAAEVARNRADEVTDAFLARLRDQHRDGLDQAKDPDFQHALFTVQKEYARCGDKELGDLLVDLLVDRTKQPSRSILQIVLNESLAVAPKLTPDQLAVLSLVFFFRYAMHGGIGDQDTYCRQLDVYVKPFVPLLGKTNSCYQHLEYSGCGALGIGAISLEQILRRNYPGLFSRGFDEAQFRAKGATIPFAHPAIRQCLNDPSKSQVNALSEGALREKAAALAIPDEDVPKLITLQNENLLNDDSLKKVIVGARPYMEGVFGEWGKALGNFTLTSVGIAIGHANIKRNSGEFTDLSIWIN